MFRIRDLLRRRRFTSNDSPPLGIDVGREIYAAAFSPGGEYLMTGNREGVQVWRLQDGKHIATLKALSCIKSLAVSHDNKWIAGGTDKGKVLVWDAETYRPHESALRRAHDGAGITGLDFSPSGPARLISASTSGTATVWEVLDGKQVRTLDHPAPVVAAKYSPRNFDRIATATLNSIRIWDYDGNLLLNISVTVTPEYSSGLAWFYDHVFVLSRNTIKKFETSFGLQLSEWSVPECNPRSCIAIPRHGEFIACATNDAVTFWDMSTRSQLGHFSYSRRIYAIVPSPDNQFLAVGGEYREVSIKSLSRVSAEAHDDSLPTIYAPPTPPLREWTKAQLENRPWKDVLSDAEKFRLPKVTVHRVTCECLETDSRMTDALECFHQMMSESGGQTTTDHSEWTRDFRQRNFKELERLGDTAVDAQESVSHYTNALSLAVDRDSLQGILIKRGDAFLAIDSWTQAEDNANQLIVLDPLSPIGYEMRHTALRKTGDRHDISPNNRDAATLYLSEWAMAALTSCSWKDALRASAGSRHSGVAIYKVLCERLEETDRMNDALDCFNQMMNELRLRDDEYPWILAFRQRSTEYLGDTAMDGHQYDEAVDHYTVALSLNHPSLCEILIKRSKAWVATGSWMKALDDANQVITLDPSSPRGYEMKHAALHGTGDYQDAIGVYETMLSKMVESPDPLIQRYHDQYVSPSSTRATIRKLVQKTIRHSPRELIDITTGRLYDRASQAAAFESSPIFNELVSSMTRRIDHGWIKHEVRQFFRYVMLSHTWDDNEPSYQLVVQTTVYDLEQSPTHEKLQMFCRIVRDGGFKWAWTDTCCIDKIDRSALQEALVAMFKWYEGSALTIVYLRGVRSSMRRGALVESIWNTRAWTLQEYIASKVVHFYTEEWTLYLDLKLPNHKESQEVISEMEEATGVSAEQLMALRPGLTNIREKLRLASPRQTTLVEDAAYSLLGIFSITSMPATYGEGKDSLGRLLTHVLAGSGDLSVLAWTGESGRFNSCLPADISVFKGPASSHIPPPIPDVEMERIIAISRPWIDLDAAIRLYDCLDELSAPWFEAGRMKLSCIAFKLPSVTPYRIQTGHAYRADTAIFGEVEIKTRHNLSGMDVLYLVHPWLDALLGREETPGDVAPPPPTTDDEDMPDKEVNNDPSPIPAPEIPSRVQAVPMDKEARARRLVARLRQPFGALLFASAGTDQPARDFRRVAADSLITVRFPEHVPLEEILDGVHTLDAL